MPVVKVLDINAFSPGGFCRRQGELQSCEQVVPKGAGEPGAVRIEPEVGLFFQQSFIFIGGEVPVFLLNRALGHASGVLLVHVSQFMAEQVDSGWRVRLKSSGAEEDVVSFRESPGTERL